MRTITQSIYTINELSEKAREKAYDDWLKTSDYDRSVDNRQVLDVFCRLVEVVCFKWEYSAYSYNFDFKIADSVGADIENLSGQRLATYIINNWGDKITEPKIYYLREKKRKSNIQVTKDCPLTGYCMDMDILEPMYQFIQNPCNSTGYYTLINACLDNFFSSCRNDVYYFEAMENFIEESSINNREYYSNGRLYA